METSTYGEYVQTLASPEFTDTASCHCSLRLITGEVATDPEDFQAWRCIRQIRYNIEEGLSGKWYLPPSRKSQPVQGYLLPDTSTWFTANRVEDGPVQFRSFESTQLHPSDKQCTGLLGNQEDSVPDESSSSFLVQRQVPDPGERPPSCFGGSRAVAITIQNRTSWTSDGCLLGFLCECILFPNSNR